MPYVPPYAVRPAQVNKWIESAFNPKSYRRAHFAQSVIAHEWEVCSSYAAAVAGVHVDAYERPYWQWTKQQKTALFQAFKGASLLTDEQAAELQRIAWIPRRDVA